MSLPSPFRFDNSYQDQLDGFYVPWTGAKAPSPEILRLNMGLAADLGLPADQLSGPDAAAWFTGAAMPDGAASIALAYAGHQFGGFSPQLGDGRALLIGEVLDDAGHRYDIHLKGSGRTPFSRGGDGKAVLGPVLREYLMGEAMHALGIPTTRALAAATTGEQVPRNTMEPGAVLTRVAASHIRVGTFQFFAARRETDKLRQLADYTIARHDPDLIDQPDRYLQLLVRVSARQARLIAGWVSVGFVHGVMNTDNMTISGETIDYGPCAFIDRYDPGAVFSSIDSGGRYAYGNQPTIGQWNLARFAETLIPLIDPDNTDAAIAQLTEVIETYPALYQTAWLGQMRAKLGLVAAEDGDLDLINDLHRIMELGKADFTQTFRRLSGVARGDDTALRAGFQDSDDTLAEWIQRYAKRIGAPSQDIADQMDATNPIYIPRNHLVEEALSAAVAGDMGPFDRLLSVLAQPFTVQDGADRYALPAPDDFGPYQTFCGT